MVGRKIIPVFLQDIIYMCIIYVFATTLVENIAFKKNVLVVNERKKPFPFSYRISANNKR